MRIVFMGSPEFAVAPLRHLLINHYPVAAVYTQPDRPSGRGRETTAPPVKRLALECGLAVKQPASLRRPEAVAELAGFRPDIIVVAAYGQILPPAVLAIPRQGSLNIHPSLLPRFRGASPVAAAILAGDEFTGVSIMLMDAGMDTGPVLGQARIAIADGDTTGSLSARLARIGAGMLLELLPRYLSGSLKPRPQDEARASYCRPIPKEAGEIDWRLPAEEISRRVRAYNPWPGAYTRWQGKRLKITKAIALTRDDEKFFCEFDSLRCEECHARFSCYTMKSPELSVEWLKSVETGMAGRVVALDERHSNWGVCTGNGILWVLELQLEGKRPVAGADFLRGQRGFIGATL